MIPGPRSPVPGSGFSAVDHAMMARALRLAERGLFTTQPNPRVGCVIARGEEIIGEGWHQRAGEPHAEVFALHAAGERARGATAYVTLEPCSHHGRTPPCADALIETGIACVVFAAEDPNPQVAGAGIQRLRAAGIAVESGLMRGAARELNRGFFARYERGRPWVRVKLAMSLDGRTALASGESKWITGAAARADVQRWRARSSAILTGAGTARADDPRLTVRSLSPDGFGGEGWGEGTRLSGEKGLENPGHSGDAQNVLQAGNARANTQCGPLIQPSSLSEADGGKGFKPLRVVLDAQLDALPPQAHLLDGSAPTLVLHAADAKPKDDRYARAELAEVAVEGNGRFGLAEILHLLGERDVNELQVEAGPVLCGALCERGWIDELLLYVAPTLLGDSARPLLCLPSLTSMAEQQAWRVIDRRMCGVDQRLLLRPASAL